MSGFWRRRDGSKRHRFGLLSRQNEVKREDQARTSWCFLHMLCRWKAKISRFLSQVFKPQTARWADFYIAGDALERFNVTRRILERVEEILEAYASGGEEVRQHLWALCDRYPRFFRRASCVLWQTPDPLTTARLYLLFLSLCYYNDPDWAATVDHVVKEALRRAPPVDRDALAALLRWVASFHAPKSDPEIWLSPREYFEQLAADVLGEAGGEGSGGAIL
jgi:hypothetical protein